MDNQSKFFQTYANLPLGARNEIILVIDDEPLTWKSVNIEITLGTEKGKIILDKLSKLRFI